MNRKIYIRQQDIHKLFGEAPTYQVTPRPIREKQSIGEADSNIKEPNLPQRECITEFYTADELAKRFGYSKSAIQKIAASKKIPKTPKKGVYLYSKRHFDEVLDNNTVDETITEWYTVKEIMTPHSMSHTAF